VAVFTSDDSITAKDKKVAGMAAWVADGRIVIEHADAVVDRGSVREDSPVIAQVAASLCAFGLGEPSTRGDHQAMGRGVA
jgi:hypothetical protein